MTCQKHIGPTSGPITMTIIIPPMNQVFSKMATNYTSGIRASQKVGTKHYVMGIRKQLYFFMSAKIS